MKNLTANLKRFMALLLAVAMVLSMAACGGPAPNTEEPEASTGTDDALSREDLEAIVEVVGDGESTEDLSDEELEQLVEELVSELDEEEKAGVVNLGNKEPEKLPTVDVSGNQDAYTEEGAMKEPFDQVYPELIEKGEVKFSGESILIKLAKDTLTDGLKAAGVGALEKIVPMEKSAWYEAKLTEGTDAKAALAAVRELDEVLLAEYNYEIKTAALDHYKDFGDRHKGKFDNNHHHKDQWHFHHCGIPDAFEKMETEGGLNSVVVAVIDSGVDYDHEDLKDNMWVNTGEVPDNGIDDDKNGYIDDYYGIDLIAGKGSADDDNGHGTHVAGIIAARNNNTGVLGIAYNTRIMSIKAATHNGTLNQSTIAKAVLYAYEMGAEVINMSFGGTACSIAVQDALATAYTRCVLVASAGNDGYPNEGADNMDTLPNYPAALTYVLGVMSVDANGTESLFTNWDSKAFSGVEYELYAPGENIMSTLPNDQYGYLSGTSMAAPVVSAFAAILRSEFDDRDMYPTKFIYGQLSFTSGYYADCVNPDKHSVNGGTHSLPQIANLNDALTKLPKPEVNMQDYAIFDSTDLSDKNNGDGVIDAGETIALGLTLRNRWGMSENTVVTLDTLENGISDPYVTIQNPTVDYGGVGTYSTKDAGKLYTDELFTGWENPFLLKIAEDIPNDYRMTFHVTVRCENALDEEDTTVYQSAADINLTARNGVILPSIIEEDMVLTADNLYIIPNSTVIQSGVTVRVEPGTHIQFWSDDPKDPYASSYIAYLRVDGNFLVEGTKENPVYIYPSELMSRYGVEIGAAHSGYVSMKYADITNFFYEENHSGTYNRIDMAEHCTFRKNTTGNFYYRNLNSGTVTYGIAGSGYLGKINARDCVFYKIATQYGIDLYGTANRCIFVQCAIDFKGTCENCVFLTNNIKTADGSYYTSSLSLANGDGPLNAVPSDSAKVFYRPETGTTYLRVDRNDDGEGIARWLEQELGGHYVKLEDQAEYDWLKANKVFGYDCLFGAQKGPDGLQYWYDGTPVGDFLQPETKNVYGYEVHLTTSGIKYGSGTAYPLFEIPGQILPETITFRDYQLLLDMESTAALAPQSTPAQLPSGAFLYESSDTNVATVSDTGVVTPVGLGTAEIWVYSLDRAVKNHVDVTVKDYVPLEGIAFLQSSALLAAGERLSVGCVLTPADTTRRNVTYTSSGPAVATVDDAGVVTGVSSGTVTITAQCEGLTDTITVRVYNKAKSFSLSKGFIYTALKEGAVELPEIYVHESYDTDFTWRTTDPSVAIIEDGKLVPKAAGSTTIVVKDNLSGLYQTCHVAVQQAAIVGVKDIQVTSTRCFVLMEDGAMYAWDSSNNTPRLFTTDVTMFAASQNYALVAKADGTIQKWSASGALSEMEAEYTQFVGKEILSLDMFHNSFSSCMFVCTPEGCYAWGYHNSYGQLGVGVTTNVINPTLVNLDGVKQVVVDRDGDYTCFLTQDGTLYVSGKEYSTTSTPVKRATDVAEILDVSCEIRYRSTSGKLFWQKNSGYTSTEVFKTSAVEEFDKIASSAYTSTDGEFIGVKNGKAYIYRNATTTPSYSMLPIANVKDVFMYHDLYGDTYYAVTEDGALYGYGDLPKSRMAGMANTDRTGTVLIPMPALPTETISLTPENLTDGVLSDSVLTLEANKALRSASPKLYADGTQITVQYQIEEGNLLRFSRADGFAENVQYELVFETSTIYGWFGVKNEAITIPFTYTSGVQDEAATEETEATEATESTESTDATESTESTEPVIYESQLDTSIARIETPESLEQKSTQWAEQTRCNLKFYGNAVLNHISTDTSVSHWLRPLAPTTTAGNYFTMDFGGNWWGTTNEKAIELQMTDYTDYITYHRLMYAPYLTEAPENTFPFVTSVKLFDRYGEEVTTVGNEEITFRVSFNRDMDTSIPLQVRFGSAEPYGDYEIEGAYVNARTWEGTYTLRTTIENGNQYFTISNGCSATDDLELQLDQKRFGFEIDTTAAQALIMQGTPTDTGIELRWTQDDFDTLMGYNVYRSTAEDGYYQRLNKTVIPADTMEWFDDTVEPGKVYYYNFTVVQTDLSESTPSGKIVIMSKDTMAPNIYHTPVYSAVSNQNLIISAEVTDNLNIAYANLYYRAVGAESWTTVRMNALNDKYSAIIPATDLSMDGMEYYIEACDGVSCTYRGSAEEPYAVTVKEALDANSRGDVDGDGVVTNRDALILLQAISDKYNMTEDEFARADLNGDEVLSAVEALRILHYVSGKVGSLDMTE